MNLRLSTVLLATLFCLSTTAFAIEGSQSAGKNQEIQKAKELEDTEKALDKKIQKLNEMLARYNKLQDIEITLTPGQTIFSKGDGYIEIENYDFIPLGYSNRAVGGKNKSVRLYFDGDKLTKVESRVRVHNFKEQTKTESKISDPSPTTEGTDDMQVRTQFNLEGTYDVKLKNMENTITNPLKIKFKREFYIPHLEAFEKLFRFTEEYQKRYGTSSDVVTIDTLKRSLNY